MSQSALAPPDVHFLIPGAPDTPTGGFVYDRHAIEGLRAAGSLAAVLRVDGPYPKGDASALTAAAQALETVPEGHVVIVDGLAFTALAPVIAEHADRLRIIALVHHPLGDETGLDATARAHWLAAETAALTHTKAIVVTSRTTRARLAELGIDPATVASVTPGVDPAPDLAFRATRAPGPLRLLCVATLIPRKGQHLLVRAVSVLRDRDWTLDLVGDARDPTYAARLADLIAEQGLGGRVRVRGAVSADRLDGFWRRADAFVFPSLHEGWGIAPVEAVRWGLPVISSDGGALPESVPEAARALVPAGDAEALAAAIAHLLDDPAHRAKLGAGAVRAARTLRTWQDMRTEFADVIQRSRS